MSEELNTAKLEVTEKNTPTNLEKKQIRSKSKDPKSLINKLIVSDNAKEKRIPKSYLKPREVKPVNTTVKDDIVKPTRPSSIPGTPAVQKRKMLQVKSDLATNQYAQTVTASKTTSNSQTYPRLRPPMKIPQKIVKKVDSKIVKEVKEDIPTGAEGDTIESISMIDIPPSFELCDDDKIPIKFPSPESGMQELLPEIESLHQSKLKQPQSWNFAAITRRSATTMSYNSLNRTAYTEKNTGSASNLSIIGKDRKNAVQVMREKVLETNKLRVFENALDKLQESQSRLLEMCVSFKSSPALLDKLPKSLKFISLVRNDECKLLLKTEDLLRFPKRLPSVAVSDLRDRIQIALDVMGTKSIRSLKNISKLDELEMREKAVNEAEAELLSAQAQHLEDLNGTISLLLSGKLDEQEVQRTSKELYDLQKVLETKEHDMAHLSKEAENYRGEIEQLSKDKLSYDALKITSAENLKKIAGLERQIEKLNTVILKKQACKAAERLAQAKLTEELKATKAAYQVLSKRFSQLEQSKTLERREKIESNCHQLEVELESIKKKMEELAEQKNHVDNLLREKTKEVQRLKSAASSFKAERGLLETEISRLSELLQEMYSLKDGLKYAEERYVKLQEFVSEQEKILKDPTQWPQTLQEKFEKLKAINDERQKKINGLEIELTKAHLSICQLGDQIHRDQQLIEVRGDLISSLQETDSNRQLHLEEMFVQVGEKNDTINEVRLSNNLMTKSEEFRNLFTTLSSKQMDISRQEHMIKLLEESNERGQMLRVQQEEKIAHMEGEINRLKAALINCKSCATNNNYAKFNYPAVTAPPAANTKPNHKDENVVDDNYDRRRKRQVDIMVKKYE